MTEDARTLCDRMLRREESCRLTVYDDHSGKALLPGGTLEGHPTIGWGVALDTGGITQDEADLLLEHRMRRFFCELAQQIPWFYALDSVRQAALVTMAYQLGTRGLLSFRHTLAFLQQGQYDHAAEAMLESPWAQKQSPERAKRLVQVIRTGEAGEYLPKTDEVSAAGGQ